MSASPTSAHASSKRPLEDPSSPSGQTEQPEAKRPALDKVSKEVRNNGDKTNAVSQTSPSTEPSKDQSAAVTADATRQQQSVDEQPSDKASVGGNAVPAGAEANAATVSSQEPQPIQSTSAPQAHASDETGWIHIRAIISSAEAATCIGKGGENVSQIRRLSGAKCTVSEYQRGAVERILTVSGPQDAVAKVSQAFLEAICSIIPNLEPWSGFWPYHPYPQQRASRSTFHSSVKNLSFAPAHSTHPHWIHHWKRWQPHSRNPRCVRCPS